MFVPQLFTLKTFWQTKSQSKTNKTLSHDRYFWRKEEEEIDRERESVWLCECERSRLSLRKKEEESERGRKHFFQRYWKWKPESQDKNIESTKRKSFSLFSFISSFTATENIFQFYYLKLTSIKVWPLLAWPGAPDSDLSHKVMIQVWGGRAS